MTNRRWRGPRHLRPATRKWVEQVDAEWQLDEHHRKLLVLAGEAWDRGQLAREAIAEHGLTYTNRRGEPRPRPEVAVERDSRIGFARTLRELGLDVEQPASRAPAIRGKL